MTIEAQLDELIRLQTQTNHILMDAAGPKSHLAQEAIEKNDSTLAEVKPKKKAPKKKAAKKKVEEVVEVDEFGLGDEVDVEEAVSEEPQMTLDDIEDELRPMVKNGRGKEAKALLAEFGAVRIKEIKDEDINAVYARLKEVNSGQ